MTKKIKVTEWNVLDYLDNEDSIAAYLQVVANEKNPKELISAIGTIAQARGINKIAEEMGIEREALYKNIHEDRQPTFDTICEVVDKLGLEIYFRPKSSSGASGK